MSRLLRMLRLAALAVLFGLAVLLVATGGQIVFQPPSLAARSVAYSLTGASDGPVATLLFLVFAALYVGAIAGMIVTIIRPFGRRRA
ncbi:MAG: hypothetical protein U0556_10710 [Dehalococcoidia bacterium]